MFQPIRDDHVIASTYSTNIPWSRDESRLSIHTMWSIPQSRDVQGRKLKTIKYSVRDSSDSDSVSDGTSHTAAASRSSMNLCCAPADFISQSSWWSRIYFSMTSCWVRRVRTRNFPLVVSTFPLCSSVLAFPFCSEGATAKFFSERGRTLVICLLFYVCLWSTRPRYLVLCLLLLVLLVRLCHFPIFCTLYAVLLTLACLLQR